LFYELVGSDDPFFELVFVAPYVGYFCLPLAEIVLAKSFGWGTVLKSCIVDYWLWELFSLSVMACS